MKFAHLYVCARCFSPDHLRVPRNASDDEEIMVVADLRLSSLCVKDMVWPWETELRQFRSKRFCIFPMMYGQLKDYVAGIFSPLLPFESFIVEKKNGEQERWDPPRKTDRIFYLKHGEPPLVIYCKEN
jgi:hypothetical protein